MGRVVMNGPPEIASGVWCLACLMAAKQKQWEAFGDDIKAGYAAAGDKITVIPWPEALTAEIYRGPYRAVCGEFPQLGVIDGLCWSHVAGINPTETPEAPQLMQASALPPGLQRKGHRP